MSESIAFYSASFRHRPLLAVDRLSRRILKDVVPHGIVPYVRMKSVQQRHTDCPQANGSAAVEFAVRLTGDSG